MFEKIKHFFDKHIALSEAQEISEDNLRIASAALLLEMMHAESTEENKKHELVVTLLESRFSLNDEQAAALLDIAEHKRRSATDFFEFTHLICDVYTHAQKLQLIEALWKIAFIDSELALEEEYLVDKFARLLFIPHIEVLQVKNKLRQ